MSDISEEITNYQKDCPLCTAYYREIDEILYEDEYCFILPTKKMKGHKKRIMVVAKEHVNSSRYQTIIFNIFKMFCEDYFNDCKTCVICESTYASIPDHCHYVACDWQTSDDDEFKLLMDTPHLCISTTYKER